MAKEIFEEMGGEEALAVWLDHPNEKLRNTAIALENNYFRGSCLKDDFSGDVFS